MKSFSSLEIFYSSLEIFFSSLEIFSYFFPHWRYGEVSSRGLPWTKTQLVVHVGNLEIYYVYCSKLYLAFFLTHDKKSMRNLIECLISCCIDALALMLWNWYCCVDALAIVCLFHFNWLVNWDLKAGCSLTTAPGSKSSVDPQNVDAILSQKNSKLQRKRQNSPSQAWGRVVCELV